MKRIIFDSWKKVLILFIIGQALLSIGILLNKYAERKMIILWMVAFLSLVSIIIDIKILVILFKKKISQS